MVYFCSIQYGFGSLKFLQFLCKNPDLNCEFSPNVTPRDGNCLLHAILDGIKNNDAFKHTNTTATDETECWVDLLKKLRIYDEIDIIQFLRSRWVLGASEWLAGGNGSNVNDKVVLGYSNKEWDYIWNTMAEDGAWAVPSVTDKSGNVVKGNQATELSMKYIAHDLHCNYFTIMSSLIPL